VETPDGDVETGDVGINSDCCMTCSGQRSVAAVDPAADEKNENGIIDTVRWFGLRRASTAALMSSREWSR
jgi:hypothetical protein